MRRTLLSLAVLVAFALPLHAQTVIGPGVLQFGDQDMLNHGSYPSDPLAGATLRGVAPGTTTTATNPFAHGWPFSPAAGEFAGTDQIFVGSNQTGFHEGYSATAGRQAGPQQLSLDYGSLLGGGMTVSSLTLGLALDDFQQPTFGQPYVGMINGVAYDPFTDLLNSINETGPTVRFFTIGIPTAMLGASHVLTVGIDEGGDGGDGWAVDFATVGVRTAPVGSVTPEPVSMALLGTGLVGVFGARRRRRQRA